MWRYSQKLATNSSKTISTYINVCRPLPANVCRRWYSSDNQVKGSSKGKLLAGLIGSSVVATGGAVVYAKYDNSFREWLEGSVPFAAGSLDYLIGTKELPRVSDRVKPPSTIQSREKEQQSGLTHRTVPPKIIKKDDDEQRSSVQESKSTKSHQTDVKLQPSSSGVAEEMTIQQRLSSQEADMAAENAAIEHLLEEATHSVEQYSTAALTSQQEALTALKTYTTNLEKALDAKQDVDKDSVEFAIKSTNIAKNDALRRAVLKAQKAKETTARLKLVIDDGRRSKLTSSNPSLITAEKLLNNTLYQIETSEAQIATAKSEANLMAEYRDLVEKAREDFNKELQTLLPEVKLGEKGKKLSDDELNYLLAHAHRRVEQLQKQMAMQQVSERQRFQRALEQQRGDHEKSTSDRVGIEVAKQERDLELQLQKKLAQLRDDFEQELRMQLRRQAAAHSDHLQDVLQVQQRELDARFDQALEEKLAVARQEFEANLARSYARLKGIEEGIKAKADLNTAAQVAQALWIAGQALRQTLTARHYPTATSWDEQLKPLNEHVQAIQNVAGDKDKAVIAVVDSIPEMAKVRGVYTESALKERFLNVYRICRRVARIDESGGGLLRFGLSFLQSAFLIDAATKLSSSELANQPIDPSSLSPFDVLSRARWCVERDDLEQALRYMNLLRGAPRVLASDWMDEVCLLLETRQAADALLAMAAASTVYGYA